MLNERTRGYIIFGVVCVVIASIGVGISRDISASVRADAGRESCIIEKRGDEGLYVIKCDHRVEFERGLQHFMSDHKNLKVTSHAWSGGISYTVVTEPR